jgi:hypothetical protein
VRLTMQDFIMSDPETTVPAAPAVLRQQMRTLRLCRLCWMSGKFDGQNGRDSSLATFPHA